MRLTLSVSEGIVTHPTAALAPHRWLETAGLAIGDEWPSNMTTENDRLRTGH